MAHYIMLSTLTDEGRKTLKDRPERIKEVEPHGQARGPHYPARGAES